MAVVIVSLHRIVEAGIEVEAIFRAEHVCPRCRNGAGSRNAEAGMGGSALHDLRMRGGFPLQRRVLKPSMHGTFASLMRDGITEHYL
jgi:hypothetical protein